MISLSHDTVDWNVIYTMPNFEKKICNELTSRGLEAYLPLYKKKRKWRNRTITSHLPFFTGYVFLKTGPSIKSQVLRLSGVIKFLTSEGKLCKVTDTELNEIKIMEKLNETFEINRVSFYEKGRSIQISEGPFSGLRGEIIDHRGSQRFLIRIHSIKEAFTIEASEEILELI